MNIHDFCFTWQGRQLACLSEQEQSLLNPLAIFNGRHERALLLLHGFSSSPAVFRAMLPQLPAYDAIVCPVLPGHADSIESFAKVKASAWVLAAEQACERLVKDYRLVDVMGLSLGGLLACHLSSRFALNHLYLLAPALDLRLNVPLTLKASQCLRFLGMRYLRNRAGNLHTAQFSELTYRQLPLNAIIEILTLVQQFQFQPPTCPTDVFVGRFDAVVDSPAIAARFAKKSHATVHWLEHSAHILPLDGDIKTIVDSVRQHY